MVYSVLCLIVLVVLVMPFTNKKIERNLEIFLFSMGVLSVLVSDQMSMGLLLKALEEPFMIAAAVLVFGLLFKKYNEKISVAIHRIQQVIPHKVLVFLIVVVLGLISSLITAIIAALFLVEIVGVLKLERKNEIALTIITCFSIGLGSALTPIGEPLATIVVSKLGVDFWYLFRNFAIYIIPTVIALGLFAAFFVKDSEAEGDGAKSSESESYKDVIVRAFNVYLFVMALTFLGTGLKPVIDRFILGLPSEILYWINMISAVLDNATLAAAEISDKMSDRQITAILMGLLISGGMLILGNIPNIISANKLDIPSKEWAKVGVPLGLVIMLVFSVPLLYMAN
ncbi:MAG: DUF1646 family protein [Acidaminococcaceae bacterium]